MSNVWYVTQGLNWTLNIQYSGQGVVIEKAYLNINQVCLFSLPHFVCILQTLYNLHYLLYVYSMILNI